MCVIQTNARLVTLILSLSLLLCLKTLNILNITLSNKIIFTSSVEKVRHFNVH